MKKAKYSVSPHITLASASPASMVPSPSASATLPETVPSPASAGALPSPIPSATFDPHSVPLALTDEESESLGTTVGEGKGKGRARDLETELTAKLSIPKVCTRIVFTSMD